MGNLLRRGGNSGIDARQGHGSELPFSLAKGLLDGPRQFILVPSAPKLYLLLDLACHIIFTFQLSTDIDMS